MKHLKIIPIFFLVNLCFSQSDKDFYDIINKVSESRIEIMLLLYKGERNIQIDL